MPSLDCEDKRSFYKAGPTMYNALSVNIKMATSVAVVKNCKDICIKLNTMQLETPAVAWQMMYRIKYWFIHLLILSTAYEHDKETKIVY